MFQLSRDEQISIVIAFLIIAVIAISVFASRSQHAAEGVKVELEQSNTNAQATSKKDEAIYPPVIYVHVTGRVLRPNVYAVWKGTRVFEVLSKAGMTEDSDPQRLNLAEVVRDGQRIEVPGKNMPLQQNRNTVADPGTISTGAVNINTASQQELESLPGIGPAYALRIIEQRSLAPFEKKEDIMKVKGIGQKTFEKLKDRISVD